MGRITVTVSVAKKSCVIIITSMVLNLGLNPAGVSFGYQLMFTCGANLHLCPRCVNPDILKFFYCSLSFILTLSFIF